MTIIFQSPPRAIAQAVAKLKSDGIVHPDAAFNPDAPQGLRREVAYHDRDFLSRLGYTAAEEETVDCALALLKENRLVPASGSYDKASCERHRREVREKFSGAWTSLSPTMERLIYMLTSVRQPAHLLELGSFWGYTLAWFAGPCLGSYPAVPAERIIGIDIDAAATAQARENFTGLVGAHNVTLIAEDARTALERIPGPFDFVYLEAKLDDGEGLYLPLLKQIYDRIPVGGWVIAHDNLDLDCADEMAVYLPYVRDGAHFCQSIAFEVDRCGLELSIK
jgi:predicted O-methyltransferase YrrM